MSATFNDSVEGDLIGLDVPVFLIVIRLLDLLKQIESSAKLFAVNTSVKKDIEEDCIRRCAPVIISFQRAKQVESTIQILFVVLFRSYTFDQSCIDEIVWLNTMQVHVVQELPCLCHLVSSNYAFHEEVVRQRGRTHSGLDHLQVNLVCLVQMISLRTTLQKSIVKGFIGLYVAKLLHF